jgi:hypothetical protein
VKAKKLISVLLVVSLLSAISSAAVAADTSPPSKSEGLIITDTVAATVLSAEEAAQYDEYNVQLSIADSGGDADSDSYINAILELCSFDSILQAGDRTYTIYKSEALPTYLNDCEEIIEISTHGVFLYITYTTAGGAYVILGYTDVGLNTRSIYFKDTDVAVNTANDITAKYVNFQNGQSFSMSEALLAYIDENLASGDLNALRELGYLDVIEFENGTTAIEPVVEITPMPDPTIRQDAAD